MKKIFYIVLLCLLVHNGYTQAGHQTANNATEKNTTISAADWQSDLQFLRQAIHKDYSFLFKKITAAEFDQSVNQLAKEIPALQPHEIFAGFARIVSSFKYGHTDISWRESPVKYLVAPINFYWFNDGVYVEGAHKNNKDILGAKLVKVEGMPVLQALEALKPLVPVENDSYYKAYGLTFLTIPEALHAQKITKALKKSITYSFEKNGKTFDRTILGLDSFRLQKKYGFVSAEETSLSTRDSGVTPLYLKNLDKIYFYEYLPEHKTVYVRQSQVQDDPSEDIPTFYNRVFDFIEKNDVEKLVLDLRLNGGGNNYKNKPVITGIIAHPKINQTGKLFVIIGRRTFSACQNLVNELSNYTNALFVGEPTSENINFYGDNRRVLLPKSGLPVFLSFAWWQDKPQWENAPWLAPHLAVDMSFDDYRNNRDPVLQTCLDYSGTDLVLDPMAHLQALFLAGKMQQLENDAKEMVSDPKYRFINFEDKFNQTGYQLLNGNKLREAVYVFQLNTTLFPASPNVWDSYAEALWKSGDTEKAIEFYNKAISLDPGGPTGTNAKNMLLKIKAGN